MTDVRSTPSNAREQAVQIREAWTNIDTTEKYGDMTLDELERSIVELDAAEKMLTNLEDQLRSARNDYWNKRRIMWNNVKHARMGAKIKYGDDSDVYKRFGGTRVSEYRRRRPSRVEP